MMYLPVRLSVSPAIDHPRPGLRHPSHTNSTPHQPPRYRRFAAEWRRIFTRGISASLAWLLVPVKTLSRMLYSWVASIKNRLRSGAFLSPPAPSLLTGTGRACG